MQTRDSLIYLGPLMSSTNKIVIPLNSFSVDAFFSVLLRKVNPPWFSKGRKVLPQTLVLEGRLEMLKSGPPCASAPLALSGRPDHKPGMFWGLDLVPPAPTPFCVAGDTWNQPDSSQDLHGGRQAWGSSVRHLAVNFPNILSPWFFLEKSRSHLKFLQTPNSVRAQHSSECNLLATK